MAILFKDTSNPRRLKNLGIRAKLLISHMERHMPRNSMIISLSSGVVADTRVTEVVTSLIMLWVLPSASVLIGLVVIVLLTAAAIAIHTPLPIHLHLHLHLIHNRLPITTSLLSL